MTSIIQSIITKAYQECCINGNYINHTQNPELNGYNVLLSNGTIVLVSDELIYDFRRTSRIEVCKRIRMISNNKNNLK